MTDFAGFGPKTKKFLRELGRNNDKAWFDAHRSDYEAHYLEPAKAFVEAAGPKLEKIAPNVVCEPRANGSIFRVNRDIRFSKDRTPYKDHIDLWFWEGQRKTAISGFFLASTETRCRASCCTVHSGPRPIGSRRPSSAAQSSSRIACASGKSWRPSTAG